MADTSQPMKRGMWSSTLEEEDAWIEKLASLASSKGRASKIKSPKQETFIEGTKIPKIIHFIWLGSNPIPRFPFLVDFVDSAEVSSDACSVNKLDWNECMLSWKKHHPRSNGWQIHVWTDKDIVHNEQSNKVEVIANQMSIVQMHNSEAFRYAMKIQHYALMSDILRLEILNTFGGIYIDIDYWCIQSLDNLCNIEVCGQQLAPLEFFCGESNTGCLELNNGLIACGRYSHPIILNMIQSIHGYYKSLLRGINAQSDIDTVKSLLTSFLDSNAFDAIHDSQLNKLASRPSAMDVIEHTGPGLLTRTVFRWLCDTSRVCGSSDTYASGIYSDESFEVCRVAVLKRDVFHPFPNHLRKEYESKLQNFIIPEVTIAVHLWGCSWENV